MPTHFLAFSHNPIVIGTQMSQLTANYPGRATWTLSFSLDEFENKATAERTKIDFVLLGPRTTDAEFAAINQIVTRVWGRVKFRKDEPGEGKWVLRYGGQVFTAARTRLLTLSIGCLPACSPKRGRRVAWSAGSGSRLRVDVRSQPT
ncbi:hypothetical protein CALCODRAFT_372420 [Calocera cornea HHB12733]|uniref:Uncharacterized protein n=1 Tax=Calocera cornea HHB12733 TaxID=1353952 RepID=A0A165EGU4_9BASI|nr:hypothetical protein CALCODRAFT_372420 [Calocera cornea HHB12733]